MLHKIAHAAAGCATAAAQKQACEAGAIGAAVGEVIAGELNDGTKQLTDVEKEKIVNQSKLAAGVIAAYAGYDVDVAASAADVAVRNNNMEIVYEAELNDLWENANGNKEIYYQGVQRIAERDALALDLLTIMFGGGIFTYSSFLKNVDLLVGKGNIFVTKDGLSAAARKLSSHSQRTGGTFPKPTGNIAQQNVQAEKLLRNILTDPNTRMTRIGRGGVEYRLPNGQGVRYNSDGSFSGFLDPKRGF